jgi:hypothetical protein
MRIQSTISSITEMLKFLPDSRYSDRATINEYSSSSTAATLSEEQPRNPPHPAERDEGNRHHPFPAASIIAGK